jgi:hypothetical protein|mmetsp:Transcript_68657/g.107374  ORF Transcript_68657/g.107374 Transcript_68657/m.107374 type:complete len:229 (-) Transcript_68657:84-770(-)
MSICLPAFLAFTLRVMVIWAYPLWETCALILNPLEDSKKNSESRLSTKARYEQWTTYWLIVVVLEGLVEKWFASFLFSLADFPFYFELKLVMCVWLIMPSHLGAAWLWTVVRAYHCDLDGKYFAKAMQCLSMVSSIPRPGDVIPDDVQKLVGNKQGVEPTKEIPVEAEKSVQDAQESAEEAKKTLSGKTVKELKKLARDAGVSEDAIELTEEEDSTKDALIDLILKQR